MSVIVRSNNELKLSYSKISTWKRCKKKFFYKYVEGIKPKKKSLAPRLGGMGHIGLETYYKGGDWKQAIKEYWEE
ncbi:MAG: PD-(D/E)XK nuclease family protein, partial [bacterium]